MQKRHFTWMLAGLALFAGAFLLWWFANRPERKEACGPARTLQRASSPSTKIVPAGGPGTPLSRPPSLAVAQSASAASSEASHFKYRLGNTGKTVGELSRQDNAILLANALIDTSRGTDLPIPPHLRAGGDPGSYVVQSRGALDASFRKLLAEAGATIVSYIPNNAYLVRISEAGAQQLAAASQTQAVLPFEPYYKLSAALLQPAVEQQLLAPDSTLKVTLFADARDATIEALEKLNVKVVAEDRSPFGPVVAVQPPVDSLTAIAKLPGVQGIGLFRPRITANDLSRVRMGVSTDTITTSNYLGLTGTNILVSVNDSGVDATNNPDLSGRVIGDAAGSLMDTDGHGTHVAGIIIGSGGASTTVSNASGSIIPAVVGQFRGKAPGAMVFSIATALSAGPTLDESYLQETPALTNAFISNNSWNYYAASEYDISAASFDAAVRDALPYVTGSQPVLFVFAAGDEGAGEEPDSILSPATAKNVITVGAIEQPRYITNVVVDLNGNTNEAFWPETDSDNQVADFSSRGNVGIGTEGDYGRFKPDLVAPGTFVISTRSGQWDTNAYYNPTNYHVNTLPPQTLDPNELGGYDIYVQDNAVALQIMVSPNEYSPTPFPNLPIYVKLTGAASPTNYDYLGTNFISISLSGFPTTGTVWHYSVLNVTTNVVTFDLTTDVVTTNDYGNYFMVLSNLNNGLGQYYRYESGSSMAAAGVSGVLALMEEFFEQRMQPLFSPANRPSPALMKALLINGARSLGQPYDLEVDNNINYQGWGLVNLPTALPAMLTNQVGVGGSSPIWIFDQDPSLALATGQSRTFTVSLALAAMGQPLRATLVWTDPPGNPAAGIKLVNDLNLVVTNLITGDVYFGNDIPAGSVYNETWDTNTPPPLDNVNNVENVFVPPFSGTNFTITVIGYRVNVNAVTANTNNVVQDYALVISSGDGTTTNAILWLATNTIAVNSPNVTAVTNQFASTTTTSGGVLLGQHVGANFQLLGTNTVPVGSDTGWSTSGAITLGETNQWHFYIITNDHGFTNAAFVTFMPPTLSIPRIGVYEQNPQNATRIEADIDLYVSDMSGLTNLDPAVISDCVNGVGQGRASLGRGGTETIVYSNAVPSDVYYVGVKSEDQMAAEYGFLAVFSLNPFAQGTSNGVILNAIIAPVVIPDGSPAKPGAALVFCVDPFPMQVQRVVVTNYGITHQNFGDLLGNLSHNQKFTVLNNHTCVQIPGTLQCETNVTYIYEDNGQGDIPGSQHTDGPGSLTDFIGQDATGLWLLTEVDNALGNTGQVNNLFIRIDKDNGTNLTQATVYPTSWFLDFVDVPANATNLTVSVELNSSTPASVDLYLKRGAIPTQTDFDKMAVISTPGGSLSIGTADSPPINAGRYFIGVFNPGNSPQNITIYKQLEFDLSGVAQTIFTSTNAVPILGDAVTDASIFVPNNQIIVSVEAAVAIADPQVSDLALTLISPSGTRVLLVENRGGGTASGFGGETNSSGVGTNLFSDFETATAGDYQRGRTVDGWTVVSNQVSVVADPANANSGNNFLALANGVISRTLPTVGGRSYTLTFAYRGPGIVGWWRGEGNANDSIYGNNGTALNVGYTAGEVGQAFVFHGTWSGSQISVPDQPIFQLTNSLSIEGWIYPAGPVASGFSGMILWRGDCRAGYDPYFFQIYSDNTLSFIVENAANTGAEARTPAALSSNQWWHVAATLDGNTGNMSIYTNGVLAALTNTAIRPFGPLIPNQEPTLGIGNVGTACWYPVSFNGDLDEISLYSRPLSASEVKAIYSAGSAGKFDPTAPIPQSLAEALISVAGVQQPVIYGSNTNWQTNSITFTATQNGTPLQITGLEPGMLLDSFTLTESPGLGYLVFTENTNLTMTPIKFAVPPFSSVSTNITISGFETAAAGDYLATATVDGWTVITNQVSVVSDPTNAYAGSNFLALANGVISRTLPTVDGPLYTLNFAYRGPGIVGWWRGERNAYDSSGNDNNGTMSNGGYTNGEVGSAFSLLGTNAYVGVPGSPSLNVGTGPGLTIEGWINPSIINPSDPYSERSILEWNNGSNYGVHFNISTWPGSPPSGGAYGTGPGCLYANIRDTSNNNHWLSTGPNLVQANVFQHVAATFDQNSMQAKIYYNGALIPPVNYNFFTGSFTPQTTPAYDVNIGRRVSDTSRASQWAGLDEMSIYNRALSGSEIKAIYQNGSAGKFDPNAPIPQALAEAAVSVGGGSPTVLLGNNTNWQTASITFTGQQNGMPLTLTGLEPGMLLDSFSMTEAPDIYYLPETSLDAFTGENAYGQWTLEIWDTRTGLPVSTAQLASWQLRFVFERTAPPAIELTHGVAVTNSVGTNQIQYFFVDVPNWAKFATNILISASAPVNLLFNQNALPTGTNAADYTLLSSATSGTFTLSSNSTPPLVPGQQYYLGVQNNNPAPVTFGIEVDFDVTPLTNGVPVTDTTYWGRMFEYDVSSNATAVLFALTNLSGDVDLVVRKGLPLPTLTSYDYGSFAPGTNDELIVIFPNSAPVPLSPGWWYLGVFNQDVTNVTYTIVAVELTSALPTIITLTNGVPYFNTNFAGSAPDDYYRYIVSPSAVRAQFEVDNPTEDVTLVARKGFPPLPDLTTYDYISANPGTNDELIVLFDFSTPVPLAAGEWYLTVVNVSGLPAAYSVMATEWPVYGTNINATAELSSGSFCLTWNSLVGVHYVVEGTPSLPPPFWTNVSPTITAISTNTTWCVPLPSPYHFFRVREGIALGAYVPEVSLSSINVSQGGVVLNWNAPTNLQFQVQWAPVVAPPTWNTFTNIVTSTTGLFTFTDDGSQTGGQGRLRFYRLLILL